MNKRWQLLRSQAQVFWNGLALREKAKRPLTLLEAASGTDPWADFLLEMALKAD